MEAIKKDNFIDLRSKAEEKLKKLPKLLRRMSADDILDLMHELHVYQIELEMQNEELIGAQHRLEQSYEKYSDLFDLAPIAYFIFGRDGLILNVNYTGSKLLGIEKRQLIGKPLSVFLPGREGQDSFFHHRNLVFESETSQNCEIKMKRRNGSTFYAMMESIVLKDEAGRFTHFRSAIIDVSKQKEQERTIELALQKEKHLGELKSRFIAMASHEFRTPLATILSSLYLVEKYNSQHLEEKRLKHIHKIRSSVQGLGDILNDFLSLGQIEKGNILNNPVHFDLVHFMKELVDEFKSNSHIHTFVYRHRGGRLDVMMDKKLLKICLNNLLGNAVKYSPEGGKIEVTTEIKKDTVDVCFHVKDNGIGIPEEDQPQIFEQFYRARNADAIQGTGLGLNIIKKLVSIMRGDIRFTSKENKGTNFAMVIPQINPVLKR